MYNHISLRFVTYFRIVLDKSLIVELSVYIKENVLSKAALECTLKVIEISEGHYTAWYTGLRVNFSNYLRSFRRKVLLSFKDKSLLENELEFIKGFTVETPKNYQLWQHRQIIVERIGDHEVFLKDLEDTKVQLSLDAKNIHCWQYRQWIVRKLMGDNDVLRSELKYTELLLKDDVYNNSAWNHRYFLIKASESYKANKDQCLLDEFNAILQFLDKSYEDNECFWNYLTVIVQDCSFLKDTVIPRLSQLIGSPEDTENYLYLRFLLRTNITEKNSNICEKLKELHPINRALWNGLCQN